MYRVGMIRVCQQLLGCVVVVLLQKVCAIFVSVWVCRKQMVLWMLQCLNSVFVNLWKMPQRVEWLPDIPTVAEKGFPGFDANVWYMVMGPPGLPDQRRNARRHWQHGLHTADRLLPCARNGAGERIGNRPAGPVPDLWRQVMKG